MLVGGRDWPFNVRQLKDFGQFTFCEVISKLLVSEDMDENLSSRAQPIRNFGHQFLIVFHVLKHF